MPEIGEPAPDVEWPNQDGKLIKLSDYRGRKVTLFAFPIADTPGCNIHLSPMSIRSPCVWRESLRGG